MTIEGLNLTEIIGKGVGFGLKKLGIEGKKKRGFMPGFIDKARGIIDPEENIKKEEKYKRK